MRRGDKLGNGAHPHNTTEFMFHVKNFYDKLKLKGYSGEQRVFVATDDEQVLPAFKKKYSNFKFFDSKCFPFKKTYNEKEKLTPDNLLLTMVDIYILSKCDFLVCTMSSNVRNIQFNRKTNKPIISILYSYVVYHMS